MRVIGEIPHPQCKITIFSWNNKYLIKLEQGLLEQTYKVSEMDVSNDDDIRKMLDEKFMNAALERFKEMNQSLYDALENF
jgi:predicted secreted protein